MVEPLCVKPPNQTDFVLGSLCESYFFEALLHEAHARGLPGPLLYLTPNFSVEVNVTLSGSWIQFAAAVLC